MEQTPLRVLLVGSSAEDSCRLNSFLVGPQTTPVEILEAADCSSAEAFLREAPLSAALLDFRLWQHGGPELLKLSRSLENPPTFLCLCQPEDAAAAVQSLALGVSSVLIWPNFSSDYLRAAILSAIDSARRDRQRDQAAAALQRENHSLNALVSELQQRVSQCAMLGELDAQLQICLSVDEAHRSIALSAERLLPKSSGALYLLNESRNLLEAVACWGGSIEDANAFSAMQCRALMRGRAYFLSDVSAGLLCQHLQPAGCCSSLCIPLVAHGQTLGTLAFFWQEPQTLPSAELPCTVPSLQHLAEGLAEHAALAIANLRLRESLHNQSVRDPLTGLFNRRYMEETLERELCSALRRNRPLSVMMVDLDHFKTFNDSFGHDVGDQVLRELARFLQSRTRGEDVVCRYGGEEFVLILPEAEYSDVARRADQLREEFKTLHYLTGVEKAATVTLSVGLATFPDHARAARALLLHADRGLYVAKTTGRDRVCTATMQTAIPKDRSAESASVSL